MYSRTIGCFNYLFIFRKRARDFTSGTINFFEGSIRQADQYSITVELERLPQVQQPTRGCACLLPKILQLQALLRSPSSAETTLYFIFLKVTSFPIDFSEATEGVSVTGKFLSSSICNILLPTNPLTPDNSNFHFRISFFYILINNIQKIG